MLAPMLDDGYLTTEGRTRVRIAHGQACDRRRRMEQGGTIVPTAMDLRASLRDLGEELSLQHVRLAAQLADVTLADGDTDPDLTMRTKKGGA